MNRVCLKYRGPLAALTGLCEENAQVRDVEGALRFIRERHGRKAEKTARAMLIALNGESILLLKLYKTAVSEGDVVSFFPLSAGG